MKYIDRNLSGVRHNTRVGICNLLQHLCGNPVSLDCMGESGSGRSGCGKCQRCMNWEVVSKRLRLRTLRCEDLNDILVLMDQLPISDAFFRNILSKGRQQISFNELRSGIVNFEGIALLLFGNVRFAFREFRALGEAELKKRLKEFNLSPAHIVRTEFKPRRRGLPLPSPISRSLTWHLGYIASSRVVNDIRMYAAMGIVLGKATTDSYLLTKNPDERKNEKKLLNRLIARLRANKDWEKFYPKFDRVKSHMDSIQKRIDRSRCDGRRNTSHYLALDYMDVYVATSMREPWEFEDVHSIASRVFRHTQLKELNLRYFDPTQSFLDNRVDKGLVEALMLKRARCTIYMAQETDTFGKDSELATTLAQGKPVLVFVPRVNIRKYAQAAAKRPLAYLQRRLPQLLAEDRIPSKHVISVLEFLKRIASFDPYFRLIGDEEQQFIETNQLHGVKMKMCRLLAEVEKDLFESRAKSLQKNHPLGIQVHLDSGVANGVLIVRTVSECARLLEKLLTNSCEFEFDAKQEPGILCLIEKISKCPYRVITKNATVSNSFWSRYLSGNALDNHGQVFR